MKCVGMAVILLLLSLSCYCQRNNEFFFWPINPSNQKIEFVEVIYVPGNSNVLYNRAKTFVEKTFTDHGDSILLSDENSSTITAKGSYLLDVEQLKDRGKGIINFVLTIRCNDNSYNYTITNFEHLPLQADGVKGGPLERDIPISGGYLFPNKYWYQLKAKSFYNVQMTIERIKEAMNEKTG